MIARDCGLSKILARKMVEFASYELSHNSSNCQQFGQVIFDGLKIVYYEDNVIEIVFDNAISFPQVFSFYWLSETYSKSTLHL